MQGEDGNTYDAAVPLIDSIPQPLCACYASRLGDIAATLVRSGRRGPRALLAAPTVRVRWLAAETLRHIDPSLHSFVSANTPEEWERLLDQAASLPDSGGHSGAAG
jgi:molybdopterin-guanine dinucleotide biosynthesis protein A